MDATFWALMPPVVAIVLALITKEVYVSLLIGILAGGLFYANFNVLDALETTFTIMGERVGSNTNIIVFLVLLGMLVALMSKSGASRAYGSWASRSIKTKRGALFATAGLGALIFVDDYFNCLTVGTVMRPVTERYKISKAKLAYIIDATAAPVCIIAPISSWAAAVGSSLPESSSLDGFSLFLQTIPFNLYALLTIVMVIFMIAMQFDFGKMKKAEAHPELGTAMSDEIDDSQAGRDRKGRVFDLVIPIITLIVLCIAAMLYTGGILEGKSIAGAFADCDSSLSLVLGSFFTIVLVFLLYIPRRVISFSEFAASLVEGFKAMVPAILILTLAWTLSGVCGEDYLNAGGFVSQENYDNDLAVVNGHSYKELKSNNTNLAILCSHNFNQPFNQPIEYAQKVGELTNMLGAGHILVQRYGDILDGKRTWQKELDRSNVRPTLPDAVAGDITAAMPYRAMLNIINFIQAVDYVVPGFAAEETLLYSPELKFYSNRIKMDENFDTNVKGLHCLGDSSGWTRGLMMASVMGVLMGRSIADRYSE